MTVQLAIRMDDALAESARAAAGEEGVTLSEWVRSAIRRQAALATARRARAEEDAGPPLHAGERARTPVTDRWRASAGPVEPTPARWRR